MRNESVSWRFAIVLLSFSLVGCGFKLAGETASLPESLGPIHLVMSNFNAQQRATLLDTFKHAGAEIVSEIGDNGVLLPVTIKTVPDRIVVNSAVTGRRVVRITRQLGFSLKSSSGEILIEQKTLNKHRDLDVDSDALLSSVEEKEEVIQDLEQALFNQLVYQLSRIGGS